VENRLVESRLVESRLVARRLVEELPVHAAGTGRAVWRSRIVAA
jgi:hypothetical protein